MPKTLMRAVWGCVHTPGSCSGWGAQIGVFSPPGIPHIEQVPGGVYGQNPYESRLGLCAHSRELLRTGVPIQPLGAGAPGPSSLGIPLAS